jgi:7-carboxy-7-deazaguanine synthase
MINVCEIYRSIQGESSRAGEVCAFVRLSGCNLECAWCDTRYARGQGTPRAVGDIAAEVAALGCGLVEITGGEPLLQPETPALCTRLMKDAAVVMVETNGSLDIGCVPDGCVRIVDVKCPGSGEGGSFLRSNVKKLRASDECKFVLTGRGDFDWAADFVRENCLDRKCPVFFSPAFGTLDPKELARWILDSAVPVRLGLQLHKIIWGPHAQGV